MMMRCGNTKMLLRWERRCSFLESSIEWGVKFYIYIFFFVCISYPFVISSFLIGINLKLTFLTAPPESERELGYYILILAIDVAGCGRTTYLNVSNTISLA